jgi:dihydrofolate reductase
MITMIAAVAENGALGKDNQLIWHLPADLKRFKRVTAGHHVIMGRKTYESLGKPLPKRTNIIITSNRNYKAEGCVVVHSLEAALQVAKTDPNPFILGGANIYNQGLAIAHRLDITEVHHEFDADVFFPAIDPMTWKEVSREFHPSDEENPYAFSFVMYERVPT